MHNREAFLNNIAKRLGRERKRENVVRPTWQHQPQKAVLSDASQTELLKVLEAQCKVIHTDYYETSQADLPGVLMQVIEAYDGNKIITQTDKRHAQYGTDVYFAQLAKAGRTIHYWDYTIGKENQQIAEQADIGITFSDMTLAESGTVALFNDKHHGRSVSLLPETYIAIIPKSTLVPRITQVAKQLHKQSHVGESVGSCISLVTGPSNSADIEMKLIVGVHGPIKASYIVLTDA